MKRIFITLLLILFIPNIALAFESRSGDFVNISSDEVVDGTLFVYADSLDIDGTVNGDVFCMSPKIEISGTVNGDILCVGQEINFSGTTTGNIRLISERVKIDGNIKKNTNVVADNLEVQDTAKLGGELFVLANEASLSGEIDDDLYGKIKTGNISAFVGGDVSLYQGGGFLSKTENQKFKLLKGTVIEGDFNFKSKQDVIKEEGVVIKGKEHKTILEKEKKNYSNDMFWIFVSIFANILISMVLISLFRGFLLSITEIIKKQNTKSLWLGFLAFFLFPLACFMLFLTMIGIPLAIILLFVFGGIIIINKSIISIILGQKLLEIYKSKQKTSLNISAVLGAIIFYLIVSIPFIGSIFYFASIIIVFGAILQYFRTNLSKQ